MQSSKPVQMDTAQEANKRQVGQTTSCPLFICV